MEELPQQQPSLHKGGAFTVRNTDVFEMKIKVDPDLWEQMDRALPAQIVNRFKRKLDEAVEAADPSLEVDYYEIRVHAVIKEEPEPQWHTHVACPACGGPVPTSDGSRPHAHACPCGVTLPPDHHGFPHDKNAHGGLGRLSGDV